MRLSLLPVGRSERISAPFVTPRRPGGGPDLLFLQKRCFERRLGRIVQRLFPHTIKLQEIKHSSFHVPNIKKLLNEYLRKIQEIKKILTNTNTDDNWISSIAQCVLIKASR